MEIREEIDLDKYCTAETLIEDLKYFGKQYDKPLDKIHIDIEVWDKYGSNYSSFKAYLYRPATSDEIAKENERKVKQGLEEYKRAQAYADRMAKELGIK